MNYHPSIDGSAPLQISDIEFAPIDEAALPGKKWRDTVKDTIRDLNGKYALVNEDGKVVIFQSGYDELMKRKRIDRLSIRDFGVLYMNNKIQSGVDKDQQPTYKPISAIWLNSKERRQYIDGVVFDPTTKESRPGILNLWEGYSIEPVPGEWNLLKDHIYTVICDGDSFRFDYLMGWMARLLQFPAEQGEVAVVMRGGEGTGKGTLAKALLKIIGQHGLAISNAKHLTSNFNGHLRDAIFLFADEAFFAGDKAHVGVLKSIITEPYLTVEAKFQNAAQMPNFLHIMMASNEEWVIPASVDARRFFVLEVSEVEKNNHAYFAAIIGQLDRGGYAAMLHELLTMDLRDFNVRDVPKTEGLQQQQKLSLATPELWWKDCLERGYVFKSKIGLDLVLSQWMEQISTELLFASYTEFAEKRRDRHVMSRETLGKFVVRMGGVSRRLLRRPIGEHLTDELNSFGGTTRAARPIEHPRPMGYAFGPLDLARLGFCGATNLQIDWNEHDN